MRLCIGLAVLIGFVLPASSQELSLADVDLTAAESRFSVDVSIIEIAASVFDGDKPVHKLSRDHFRVLEGGAPQEILSFESSGERLQCAILLDATGSMRDHLPALKEAVLSFLDGMQPDDDVALFSFGRGFRLEQGFTRNRKLAKKALLGLRPEGDTALFDSMARTIRVLENRKGKKALIVFTDGRDNKSGLNAEGAGRRARRAGIPVYAIAQGAAARNRDLQAVLGEMADDTGGLAFSVSRPSELSGVFAKINRNLSSTYMLAIKAPENAIPGWHPIDVKVDASKPFRIRARKGYQLQ